MSKLLWDLFLYNYRTLLKTIIALVALLSSFHSYSADGDNFSNHKKRQYTVTPFGHTRWGLEYLPDDFNSSSEKYPIIVFFHGTGETGSTEWSLGKLLYNGPSNFIANDDYKMKFKNPNTGQDQKCIYIALQDPYWSPDINEVWYVLKNNPRLKDRISNIFYTGLSAGGQQTMNGILYNQEMANGISAVVPMSSAGFIRSGIPYALNSNVKSWAFHGLSDNVTSYTVTKDFHEALGPNKSKWTQLPPVHGGWNTIYNKDYREVINGKSMNIYEWMLSTTSVGAPPPPSNLPPVANAGNDISRTLPVNNIWVYGSGSDPDGSVDDFKWTKIAGPSGINISNSSSASCEITGFTQGIYKFELEVTDDDDATARDTMQIVISGAPPNQAPVANAGVDLIRTLPISSIMLNGSGYSLNSSIEEYEWTKISGPSGVNISNSSSANAQLTGLVQGIYQFQLEVTDDEDAVGRDTMQLTVNGVIPPNQAPYVNAGGNITITLPVNTTNLAGSGTDPDGTITGYLWTKLSGPAAGTLSNATSATATVGGLVQGTYLYQFRVTDNGGATATDVMQVTVNASIAPPNQVPYVNAGGNLSITLPVSITNLAGSGSDPDGTITGYLWTKVSGPAGGTLTNATSATATASALVQGVYQFQLKVTDNNGATATDMMQLTVNSFVPPNQIPYVNAGGNVSITLPVSTTNLAGSGSDPDGTITGYLWTKLSGPAGGTLTNASSPTATASGLVQGIYHFQFMVTDNNGATATDVMQVTVNATIPPPNQTPYVNAGGNVSITLPASTTNLSGSGTDPDGTITGYLWTKLSGPAGGTISNPTSASTLVSGLVQGVYLFQFRVTDNAGATATDVVQVTVNPLVLTNIPPIANAGPDALLTMIYNAMVLTGNGFDADGSVTGYFWRKISGPGPGIILSFNSQNTTLYALVQGVYKFELKVTDNNGATGMDTIQVTVNGILQPNLPPTVTVENDVTIRLPINTAALSATGNDVDGTITSYLWTKIAGPIAGNIVNANSENATANALAQGIYKFEIKVTDNNGATGRDTMQVTVNGFNLPPNQFPIVNAGNDILVFLPATVASLSGSATDVDGTIAGYQWIKLSGPASGTIVKPLSAITSMTGLTEGVYQLQLRVTDNLGAVGTDNIQITVQSQTITKSIHVNVYNGSVPYINPQWNNWKPASNENSSTFTYANGEQSNVFVNLSSHSRFSDNGTNYATGATVCPPDVLRFNTMHSIPRTLTISGLDPNKQYHFEFFGSRFFLSSSRSIFSVGNVSDTINTDQNENDFAKLNNIMPGSNGNVIVDLTFTGSYHYLAGFTIIEEAPLPFTNRTNETAPLVNKPVIKDTVIQQVKVQQSEVKSATSKSPVSVPSLNAEESETAIFPNPFKDQLSIKIKDQLDGDVVLKLSDASGRLVWQKTAKKQKGEFTQSVQTNSFKSGVYFLQIINKEKRSMHKLIKL